jgi:hypothetical protein
MEIVGRINATAAGYEGEPALYAELNAIEARLFKEIATTRDGLIAQLRFLRSFIDEGFEFDDDCERLVTNAITGLSRMGGVA